VGRSDTYDEPTCGPGPFSMAGADTVTDILVSSGYEDISLNRCDLPILIGRDVEQALDLVMSLGPAGELLRLWGDRKADQHDEVRAAVTAGLEEFSGPDGVRAPASTWIVSGVAPA
jgi:hypothetical protein